MIYEKENVKIVNQCVDTLVLGFRLNNPKITDNKKSVWNNFLNEIRDLKETAKKINSYGEKFVRADFGFGMGDFFVSSRSKGEFIADFKNEDIYVSVANLPYNTDKYHLRVEFRSLFLLKYGHKRAYEAVEKMVKRLFGDEYTVYVLRFDLATDIAGIKFESNDLSRFQTLRKIKTFNDIKDILLIDDEDKKIQGLKVIHNGDSGFMQYRNIDGFSFSKAPLMFRIYDKLKQISQKRISHLIMTKWILCGFNPKKDKFVFRFELEMHRQIFKQFAKKFDFYTDNEYLNEVDFLFKNLDFFWRYGTHNIIWRDLSVKELLQLTNATAMQAKRIYDKCDNDLNRFDFWRKYLFKFETDEESSELQRIHDLSTKSMRKAINALKYFVSAVYQNAGYDIEAFKKVFEAAQTELHKKDMDLHDYGLMKLCGKCVDYEKHAPKDNPYLIALYTKKDDLLSLFERLKEQKHDNDYSNLKYMVELFGAERIA